MSLLLALLACKPEVEPEPTLSAEELLDPAACVECHPSHVDRWSGSMHAYASIDPVFRAMNARGQRETNGALGDFCVRCHAPVALAEGATVDGTNLDELPDALQGVSCAFCHRIDEVLGDHNAQVGLDTSSTLRGGIPDPTSTTAHRSTYSPLHDRDDPDSSSLCGACHDVVLDNGIPLERTYVEWQESIFSGAGLARQSCGHCHMPRSQGQAAEGGPTRDIHDHLMPAVDVAMVPFPLESTMRASVQDALDYTLISELCVTPLPGGTEIALTLENIAAGHRFPSGAAHDRRVWVELVATDADGNELLRTAQPAADQALSDLPDPNRWELHDVATTAEGDPAHMFWEVDALEERTLPMATTTDPSQPGFLHSVTRTWPLQGLEPARVEARIYLRPFGLEVIDDLIATGDLDPALRDAVPTFELGPPNVVWQGEVGSCQR